MDLRSQIIGFVLGQTDVLFAVYRKPALAAAYFERRRMYAAAGVLFTGSRFGAGFSRMATSRLVAELRLEGVMTLSNRSGARTTHAKLTPAGLAWAREQMGLPSLESSFPIIDLIYALSTDDAGFDDAAGLAWSRETLVAASGNYGEPGTAEKLVDLAERLQPALSAGLVTSNCDSHGRGWYALTLDGIAVAARRLKYKLPGEAPRKFNGDCELWDSYLDALDVEPAAIRASPRTSDIGRIPVSSSPITRGQIAARTGNLLLKI